MIYLSLLFFLFSLLFTYKNLNNNSTRFLYGIILGWLISFFSLALLITNHNYYQYILYKFYNLNLSTLNILTSIKSHLSILTNIRLLNLGFVTFYYCFFCFSIAITSRKKQKNKLIYLLLLIIPLLQCIFYDPYIYTFMYNYFDAKLILESFNIFMNDLQVIFKFCNLGYLFVTFYILINYYINYPNIKFLKRYTLYNILSLVPLGVLYYLMFSWYPKVLIKPTFIKNYYNYLLPDLDKHLLYYNIFPYIVLISLCFLLFVIYKYNSIETYYKGQDLNVTRSLDTAYLGVRTFTHSIKNHLLAIQSETDFLKEKHENDEETLYSLNLISDSCSKSFEYINVASNKLKKFEMNLNPQKINIPVDQAISTIKTQCSDITINTYYINKMPLAFIDTHYFTEAVYNILSNAVEAISGSTIKKIDIRIEVKNNWGIISITDTGHGIPEEHLEKIFTPFFSTKASINNWGIGLSYCNKIITGHDGNLFVESNNHGTTFRIALPIL